jgi:hypothetical protein
LIWAISISLLEYPLDINLRTVQMLMGVSEREAARRDDPSNLRGPSSRTPRHPMPGNIHTGIGTTTQLHVFYRFFP